MQRSFLAPLTAIAAGAVLGGCATQPALPVGLAPGSTFTPEEDFVGRLYGRGEFRAINGVRRPFDVTLDGAWDGATLTLREDFRYADGETGVKTWRLKRLADGAYEGTREDVVGVATGRIDGDAYRMEYTMAIPKKKGGVTHVRFQDVIGLNASGAVLNDARVSLRGIRVARVSLTMQRSPFETPLVSDKQDQTTAR